MVVKKSNPPPPKIFVPATGSGQREVKGQYSVFLIVEFTSGGSCSPRRTVRK